MKVTIKMDIVNLDEDKENPIPENIFIQNLQHNIVASLVNINYDLSMIEVKKDEESSSN